MIATLIAAVRSAHKVAARLSPRLSPLAYLTSRFYLHCTDTKQYSILLRNAESSIGLRTEQLGTSRSQDGLWLLDTAEAPLVNSDSIKLKQQILRPQAVDNHQGRGRVLFVGVYLLINLLPRDGECR